MGGDPHDPLLAELAAWAGQDRVRDAAAARSRTRALADVGASTATWVGLLIDLAERRSTVSVTTTTGGSYVGRVAGVARDFCHLASHRPVLVRIDALAMVAPAGVPTGPAAGARPAAAAAGHRVPEVDLSMLSALEALTAERTPVVVHLLGGGRTSGEAVSLGEDLLTLRSDGSGRPTVHVRVDAVVAVELI